ncbi:hypothetical protein BD410DRAFT_779895 [Rickenella mellea]|uniref:AAA+ ATPase domain-containing protein n=1 Tax=Rickenella mellea TaxID=50990 RepID=A0A4R5XGZ6_9AGAM|nr:hypothetical protein BD410DRAFT_779895 [Rickenella mellea]
MSSAMKGHAPTPSPSTDSLEPKDSDEAMAINSSIQEPNLASGISGSQPNSQTRIRRNPSRKSRPVHPIVALSPEPVAPPPILEVRTPSPPLLITIEDTPVASERNYLPGGSQEDPITVESSPVKIRALPPASDFFAPRPRSIAPVFRTPPTRNASPGIQTPLPSAESQHVKGVQSKFGVPLTLLNRFDHANLSPTRYDENPPLESLRRPPSFIDDIPKQFHVRRIHTPEEQETFHAQTPLSHRIHPAISRFTTSNLESHGTNDKPQEMWNEKWRPRRAVEVLGNESSAEYLKAWLRALAVQFHPQAAAVDSSTANGVQGVKRKGTSKPLYGSQIKQPSVVRAVGKRQRKRARVDSDDDDILDFIATDDDGWESACETSEDEMEVNDASSSEMNDTTNDGVMSPPPRLTRLRRGHRPEPDTLDVNIDDTVQPENRPLPPSSPPPRPSSATYDFSHYLTNTILLTGPTGAGKTAAVYACATELGWQVFEVHPGTGKRNGANLHALVGDVGKNHMVGAAPSRVNGATLFGGARTPVLSQGDSVKSEKGTVNATQSIHALFSKGKQVAIKDQGLEDNSTNKQPETLKSKTAGFGFLSSHHDSLHEDGDASATPRQSIILLEEVDILFNEDANFWPAVVNLIKTSRRPVILTCNDPSLVPLSDLPVQTTLTFIPCPTPLATSYLHSLAVQEDYIVSQDLLTSTYELTTQAPTSTDLTEDFALAVNSGPFRTFDLRRAINGLQILCQSIPHDGEVASNDIRSVEKSDSQRPALDVHAPLTTSAPVMGTALRDLRDLERLTETASFMDSEVQQRSLAALEVFIVDDDNSSIDEEQGFTTLHNVASGKKEVDGVIALYSVADYIAQEGLFLATKSVVSDGRCGAWTPFTAGDLFYGRREHWTQIGDVLDRVVGGYGVISPSTLVLDYEPYVRWMVRVDDEVDSRWMESRGVERRWGRATRNSQRQEYARYVNLGHEHRRTLSNTAFRVEDTFCDDRR